MNRSLPLHGDLPEPAARPRLALSAKGFRPFFLLAAVFAVGIVPLWLAFVAGEARPSSYLEPTTWHAHEMIFGFAAAVLAGFLLTAVGNWTQRETAVGAPLLALAALWVAGRVAMTAPGLLPRGADAALDLAFLPALGVTIARPLVATKNRRNFVMLAVLGALFAANLVVHLEALGYAGAGAGRRACLVAVDVVLVVVTIIAGRVFPMFTRNATGVASIRSRPSLDAPAIAAMAGLTLVDAVSPESTGAAAFAALAGALAVARAVGWWTPRVAKHPLLWILHVGYAWIPLGLALRALAAWDGTVPRSVALHALTVGAIGSLTLGMMARVALGHTGRALVASKPTAWAFAALSAAAVVRVFAPLLAPGMYLGSLVVSGTLWTIAFVLFLVVYVPILTSPRVDGKAG
jgi:uncharacterized protein involved in response to NO